MSEGGAIGGRSGVASAVADAIEHLGVRVTGTPLKASVVWELLDTARRTTRRLDAVDGVLHQYLGPGYDDP
jgi:hypothetical protein